MRASLPLHCRRAARSPILWVALALLVLAVAYQAHCRAVNELPAITIPTVPRPNPNALDFFVRAGKLSYEPDSKTDAAREAMVTANEPALKVLRRGFAYPFQMYASPATDHFPNYAKFRSLSRLLAAEQKVNLTHGDYGGAANSGLDGLQFAIEFQHGGSTVDGMVGNACESIARRHMWAEIDHLNADEAAAAARRLEAIDAGRESFADSLQVDEWGGESELLSLMRKDSLGKIASDLRPSNIGDEADATRGSSADADRDNREFLTLTKRQVMANYVAKMAVAHGAAMSPYNAAQTYSNVSSDPISRLMVFQDARSLYFTYTVNEMQDRLLTVALALRAYHLRTAAYPNSLGDLIGAGILAHMPEDPFTPTTGSAFPYRRLDGDKYLLYSVGPDGIDNYGAPIQVKDAKTFREQVPQSADKGDWVVGANTPTALDDPSRASFHEW